MRAVNVLVTLVLVLVSRVEAQPRVKLNPETLEAFESFVEESERLLEKRLGGELPFLWTDDDPGRREMLRNGEILIETPAGIPDIKGGLLHVWLGAMFVPEATGPRVLVVLQDYDRHQDWYPEVVDSKLLGSDGDTLSGYQRLLKKKVLTAVLNTRHEARYRQVSEGRWAGSSRSTRIAEVENAGKKGERELPVGEDSGFLWRLHVYWSIEEAEGGAFVECLTVSLSRQVPWGLGWMIKPIVTSLPRESLEGTLQATRLAVRGSAD